MNTSAQPHSKPHWLRFATAAFATTAFAIAAFACSPEPPPLGSPTLAPITATVHIVDEDGVNVVGAQVEFAGRVVESDGAGLAVISRLDDVSPVMVRGDGFIDEPFVVGRSDNGTTIELRLLRRAGRLVMHFGGDMMFGRRYESGDDPLIRAESRRADAADIVRDIAPTFAAADISAANLETVLTTRPLSEAYPKKLYLIESHPDTAAALHALGLDVVIASNNHTRDWLDAGVADTVNALREEGLPSVGAGVTADEATAPLFVESQGQRVAFFSYTTLDGDTVNDQYPTAEEIAVEGLADEDIGDTERWLYDLRSWGFTSDDFNVPVADRVIGDAWEIFRDAEDALDEGTVISAWNSLRETYPEMQDWVARRGHGGAAVWGGRDSQEDIEAATESSDLVVVQMHGGYQFQSAASTGLRRVARRAIDAGADIFIGHHPHVFQGIEWYRGKLIVYSLGNFVFDQDFLITFASAFVRTVWEGDELIEARLIPLELNDYRPSLVADDAARRTIDMIWERSATAVGSQRLSQHEVITVDVDLDEDTVQPHFVVERHSARITQELVATDVSIGASAVPQVIGPGLFRFSRGSSVELGRDLFGWGGFEDPIADETNDGTPHFHFSGDDRAVVAGEAAVGERFFRMRRWVYNRSRVFVRPVARVAVQQHRRFEQTGVPIDGAGDYELRFLARQSGRGTGPAEVRVDFLHFDDTDSTRAPATELLGEHVTPFTMPSGQWDQISVRLRLPERTNVVVLYIYLEPAETWESILDLDELQFVEWRAANEVAPGYAPYQLVRSGSPTVISGTALR